MYKIIAIIGESGSGKDTIFNQVINKSLNLNKFFIIGGGISPFSKHKKTESAIKRVRLSERFSPTSDALFFAFVKIMGIR